MSGLIVHEWISKHGGSENVLDVIARSLPEDDIFCLWNDASNRFPGRVLTESWLAKSPLRRNKAAALPLMPTTWQNVDLSKYDSVVVSSHAFAHHVGRRSQRATVPIHVYVHTPARYIWAASMDDRGQHPLVRSIAPAFRYVDRKRAAEGPVFAANSDFVRQRIERSWGQHAEVIFPPVRVDALLAVDDWSSALSVRDSATLEALPGEFIFGASRFVPYKRLDKVIETGEACQLPVVLAGAGPQESELRRLAEDATVPVHFVNRPSDELLYSLYQRATVFVFPAIEDFGIMPVEAMTLGTPVLVNPVGGAKESVELLDGGGILPTNRQELQAAVTAAVGKDMTRARQRSALLSEGAFASRLLRWKAGLPINNYALAEDFDGIA